jgi:hypothetical protein
MLELKIGKGTIIASTLRFEGGMGKQPLCLRCNNLALWLTDKILKSFAAGENYDDEV